MILHPAARYPADPRAVFVLALSVFTGVVALALQAAPDSLASFLPSWAVALWGSILVAGSAIALLGMASQTVNGISTEQVGSVMVGVSTLFYSILAVSHVGDDAVQAVGIIAAWGIACLIRWGQLQVLINTAYKNKVRDEVKREIEKNLPVGEA